MSTSTRVCKALSTADRTGSQTIQPSIAPFSNAARPSADGTVDARLHKDCVNVPKACEWLVSGIEKNLLVLILVRTRRKKRIMALVEDNGRMLININRVFYTNHDVSYDYDAYKIAVDSDNIVKVMHALDIRDPIKNQIFGVYGDNDTILKFLQTIFENKFNDRIPALLNSLSDNDEKPSVWTLNNNEKFIFVIILHNDIDPSVILRKNDILIIMQKFLQDICQHIFICPTESFFLEFSIEHPFKSRAHSKRNYKMLETEISDVKIQSSINIHDDNIIKSISTYSKSKNKMHRTSSKYAYLTSKIMEKENQTERYEKLNKLENILKEKQNIINFSLNDLYMTNVILGSSITFLTIEQLVRSTMADIHHCRKKKDSKQYDNKSTACLVTQIFSYYEHKPALQHNVLLNEFITQILNVLKHSSSSTDSRNIRLNIYRIVHNANRNLQHISTICDKNIVFKSTDLDSLFNLTGFEENDRLSFIKSLEIINCFTTKMKKMMSLSKSGPYFCVQCLGDNPVFFFQSKLSIDIIDRIYCQLYSLNIPQTNTDYQLQIFTDYIDTYCLLFDLNTKSDTNLTDDKQNKQIGNHFFDIIKYGELKFGTNLVAIDSPEKNIYHLIVSDNETFSSNSDNILNYFKNLRLSTELTICHNISLLFCLISLSSTATNLSKILASRVPLQICTIETGSLIPLFDGKRDFIDHMLSKKSFKIETKAREISFSYLDNVLRNLTNDIKIIEIIGRQSIAAGRCTDGVWMSHAYINNTDFIVFDCEGLFSDKRTEEEEIKLIAFLSAVCDITILIQDLSFDRYQDRLFSVLSHSINRLTICDELFK
ncbi:unnamed protein product, partial [Didymodactylos carnosus]